MQISLTQVRKILQGCQFDPKKPGPMKVIADVGQPEYYRLRAIELLTGCRSAEELRQAIGLLVLCIASGAFDDEKTEG